MTVSSVKGMLFIVPSRNRPHNVRDLIEEWCEVTYDADLLIAVDNDDPMLDRYKEVEQEFADDALGILPFYYGPRKRLGPTLNYLAVEYSEYYWAIGFMGDDHRPRTAGWDVAYKNTLVDLGSGFVYGNDLLQGENIPTQIAITSDIIGAMGYMVPPKCTHLYFDNMWKILGKELGRIKYLPDVIVEHMHPIAGKADVDDGYVEVNSPQMYAHDLEEFNKWVTDDMPDVMVKLRKMMEEKA